jgi:hypothetical protein
MQGDNAARDIDLLCDVELRRIPPCSSVSRHSAQSRVGWLGGLSTADLHITQDRVKLITLGTIDGSAKQQVSCLLYGAWKPNGGKYQNDYSVCTKELNARTPKGESSWEQ